MRFLSPGEEVPRRTQKEGLNMEPSTPAQTCESSSTLLQSSPANPELDALMSDINTVISASGAVDQRRRSSSLVFKQLKPNTTLANDENRFWVSTVQRSGAESPGFEPSRDEDYATSSEFKGKIKLDLNVGFSGFEDELEGGKGSDDKEGEKILLSSGSVEVGVEMLEEETRSGDAAGGVKRKRCSREEKGKRKLVEVDEELDGEELVILDEEPSFFYGSGILKRWRASREEREKRKLVMDDLLRSGIDVIELDSEPEAENSVYDTQGRTENKEDQCKRTVSDVSEEGNINIRGNESKGGEYRQRRFLEVARQQAQHYAVFNENHRSLGAESEGTSSSLKNKSTNVNWVPRNSQDHHRSKPLVPSLLELSMKILVKNTDAITSLEGVPDEVKNRLSQLVCDSRRMNTHFFSLLVCGSPAEVRLRDCSWLTEEEFTKSFADCDTKHLMVLQLDQCGRCLPDYVLQASLARSPKCLPALAILSLLGAFRLSDVGISALVSSAPALRSINLSQCSLLTSISIKTLADSLESSLKELYIDDCQNIDAMLILPPLQKLKHLEVLSLAGIQTVCDDFIREFITACGHNMKELVLTDCVKLTDTSLKVIAESSSGLCRLDLANLCKLTDSAVGYLANGCRAIQTLKLGRNSFSDEAIAAYLETSGESLKELSLNNLTKITNVFVEGHSNPNLQIIGLKLSSILENLKVSDPQQLLKYSPLPLTIWSSFASSDA
ncbi:uncharacterized protein LOC132166489 isoform X2 [Corylus avellana]|uniref:uncharacterized protein LOC132166489 isoform X2 n=1 Tax=Corylus avellana TaxID=13451 RepID=UPI00286BFADF|nr:uncharacterized protein LOC132166489 isoform X2 [Corylus avellana]